MPRSPRLFTLTAWIALLVDAWLAWGRLSPSRATALAAAGAAVAWGLTARPARGGPLERLLAVLVSCGAFWWGALTLLLDVRVLFASGALALLAAAATHTALVYDRLSGSATATVSAARRPTLARPVLYGLVFVAVALATLWASEAIARALSPLRTYELVPDDPGAGPCLVRRPDDRLVGRPGCVGHYVHREFRGVEVAINGLGLRDGLDEAGPPAPGEPSVVVLGDSFAFGLGVPLEATFQERLEIALEKALGRSPVRVFGTAMPGAGVVDERRVLEDLAPLARPDVVVLELFEGNDLQDTWSRRHQAAVSTAPIGSAAPAIEPATRFLAALLGPRFWLASSSLLQLRRVDGHPTRGLEMALQVAPPPSIEEMTDAVLAELDSVATFCRRRGAKLLVLLVPDIVQAEPRRFEEFTMRRPERRFSRTGFHTRLLQRLTKSGFDVIDTLGRLEQEEDAGRACYYREGHWNEHGHGVAAELLVDPILSGLRPHRATREDPDR